VKFYGKLRWSAAILTAMVVAGFIYGLFGLAMKFPFYHGIFQLRLPGLI
jgi:hypothetical protein